MPRILESMAVAAVVVEQNIYVQLKNETKEHLRYNLSPASLNLANCSVWQSFESAPEFSDRLIVHSYLTRYIISPQLIPQMASASASTLHSGETVWTDWN